MTKEDSKKTVSIRLEKHLVAMVDHIAREKLANEQVVAEGTVTEPSPIKIANMRRQLIGEAVEKIYGLDALFPGKLGVHAGMLMVNADNAMLIPEWIKKVSEYAMKIAPEFVRIQYKRNEEIKRSFNAENESGDQS